MRTTKRPGKDKFEAKIRVYSCLSLQKRDVHRILPTAEVVDPIAREDIYRDVDAGFHVVVIIDGVFEQSMAVSPSEIMDAMRCGIKVYGASSMGALRAAELYEYGMVGHGEIFERIRAEPFYRDDYVAQVFHREEGRIIPISTTFEDFRFNVEALGREGKLTRRESSDLIEACRTLHYSERNAQAVIHRLKLDRYSERPAVLEKLRRYAELSTRPERGQKRRDAISALKQVKLDLRQTTRLNHHLNLRTLKHG